MTGLLIPLVTGQEVTFWICAPLMVLGALGLVLFRKAVYSALSMAFVMINLAVLYASMDAPFLFAVQIVVYTGAIMMLFLFVLMLVGVDTPDSVVETIRGQRTMAVLAGLGLLGLIGFGVGGAVTGAATGLERANSQFGGPVEGLATLIFGRYLFVFELTSALLIVAAVGAMILAHANRTRPKAGQRELAERRMKAYAATGAHPGSLPNSGVFSRHNSIATPALLPDGSVAPTSISKTLAERGVTVDSVELSRVTQSTFAAISAVAEEEETE
ncbi:MAG: NADH-quinone oxidoreductase subunit J [Micropruina sp.]|nr:MAG: NADH-quinone oxidoreductase subunit J [Micropruina sp.]